MATFSDNSYFSDKSFVINKFRCICSLIHFDEKRCYVVILNFVYGYASRKQHNLMYCFETVTNIEIFLSTEPQKYTKP